jgi:hypothetical protein
MRHRLTIADVCLNETDAPVLQRLLEVEQAARIRQLVDDHNAIRRVSERVANKIAPDETRSARYEEAAH